MLNMPDKEKLHTCQEMSVILDLFLFVCLVKALIHIICLSGNSSKKPANIGKSRSHQDWLLSLQKKLQNSLHLTGQNCVTTLGEGGG